MLRECPRRAGARRGICAPRRRERNAKDAREFVRPACAKIHGLQHAFLARREVQRLPSSRELSLRRRAPVRCSDRAAWARRLAVVDSRREEKKRIFSAHAPDFEFVPIITRHLTFQAKRAGPLQLLGRNCADRPYVFA
jgi:hypothetical protein